MSDAVTAALVAALGAVIVALITLYQHRSDERDKRNAKTTEKRLDHGDALFDEYRSLLEQLRIDRDQWRTRALAAERHKENS